MQRVSIRALLVSVSSLALAACSSGPVGGAAEGNVGTTRAEVVVGNAQGANAWVIHPNDGLPNDVVVASTAARRKRAFMGSKSGTVIANGSPCAVYGAMPATPGKCTSMPGGPQSDARWALLGLDAADRPFEVWGGGDVEAYAFDFTGRGFGEAITITPGALGVTWMGSSSPLHVSSYGLIDATWQVDNGFHSFGFGDFDGDGHVDLVGWNAANADDAWRDDELGVFTFDSTATPRVYRTAFPGMWSGSWRHSADDRLLAVGNFLGGRKDGALVASGWGWGLLVDAPADGGLTTHMTAPWLVPYGTKIGEHVLASTSYAQSLGDVTGDGADDLILGKGSLGGAVEIASLSSGITGFTMVPTPTGGLRRVATYGTTIRSIATLHPGDRIDDFPLTPTPFGVLPLVGADVDGDGRAELVYVGNAGIMVAKWNATDGRFHVVVAAPPGTRIGQWLVGPADAPLSVIRRTNGRDALFVESSWGVGLVTFDRALENPWLGAYTPEPTLPYWNYCCDSGENGGRTVSVQASAQLAQSTAEGACVSKNVYPGTCVGPYVEWKFCCWGDQPRTVPASTTRGQAFARGLAEQDCAGKLTDNACESAAEPVYDLCCVPAYDPANQLLPPNERPKPFDVKVPGKTEADAVAKAKKRCPGEGISTNPCKTIQKPISCTPTWKCCKTSCTAIGTCSKDEEKWATTLYDDSCKWSSGPCDPDCWPQVLQP